MDPTLLIGRVVIHLDDPVAAHVIRSIPRTSLEIESYAGIEGQLVDV